MPKAVPTPGDGIGGKQVDVHVVVRLDNKLCLLAEGGHPELPEHILVGEVVVGVVETALQESVLWAVAPLTWKLLGS